MHSQIFPGKRLPEAPSELLDISKRHLAAHGLSPEGAAVLPEIDFNLPKLEGSNLREHFHALGEYAVGPYLDMAKQFANNELPLMPERWVTNTPGWTRYGRDGSVSAVPNLNGEKLVCFDVETLYKLSPYPVMATAASPDAWYSWLSPSIFEDPPVEEPEPREPWDKSVQDCYPHHLIPMFEGNAPTIVVGHNVGYDRARVKDEYTLDRTPTRWLDTLSLHVATRGITSVQRPTWMKHRKTKREQDMIDSETREAFLGIAKETGDDLLAQSVAEWTNSLQDEPGDVTTWEDTTSANSLADVAKLHCNIEVDKSIRDRFGDEEIRHASELRPELDMLLDYCARDVKITHGVYKVVLPLFLTSCPHPASFAGILSMGNSFLPVDKSWGEYLRNSETLYQNLKEDVRVALRTLAERLKNGGPPDNDPWASQLDWTPKNARWPDKGVPADTQEAEVDADVPSWYAPVERDEEHLLSIPFQRRNLPLLLQVSFRGYPVYFLQEHHWCFKVPMKDMEDMILEHGLPVELSEKDRQLEPHLEDSVFFRISKLGAARTMSLVGKMMERAQKKGLLTAAEPEILEKLVGGEAYVTLKSLHKLAKKRIKERKQGKSNDWLDQLDWGAEKRPKSRSSSDTYGTWPKWYWDLSSAPTNKHQTFGELDLTMRKTLAPLLLKMKWRGYPLAYSKEHKWIYRVPKSEVSEDEASAIHASKIIKFAPLNADEHLLDDDNFVYFRIPHKDGEGNNVGNPLSKAYLKAVESGELSSALSDDPDEQLASAAQKATNMNALCSYWISSRERIMNQFVVYGDDDRGMILPQVVTMGTVTRRAVEKTWLTASNAKRNRVGSELKAMVRAPPGYSIVGADVDSEELWISSVMGDSQFGVHGATAIGWMTLEGTKSAGTDLHSKTANILNISRDAAKVFNYSRIYGAGKKHAIQLLLQGDSSLTPETADQLAANLYMQTKGTKTFRDKKLGPAATQYLWHGGSESYLFNTLEAIALMDRPTTPALGCGVTRALRKSFLDAGHSYLPSRINWVVQSSGVDYLHLLITSMEYLIEKYGIQARYLISVHDEVRYLAKEEDKYRTALALQIANAWTRGLFCYNLGLDDMPQGIAFFSAVDVDHILRKETDMTCVTPSHPEALPPGESLDINQILERTGGVLGPVVSNRPTPRVSDPGPPVRIFGDLTSRNHARFLGAQAEAKRRPAKMYLDSIPTINSSSQSAPSPKSEPDQYYEPFTSRRSYFEDDDIADAVASVHASNRHTSTIIT